MQSERRPSLFLFLLILIWSPFSVHAQLSRIMDELAANHTSTPRFSDRSGMKMLLNMPYGKAYFSSPKNAQDLNGNVVEIELVYTDFKRSMSFDQSELNKRRVKHLLDKFPYLKTARSVRWTSVAQTGAVSAKEAGQYFHGFAISIAKDPVSETRRNEIQYLKDLVDGKPVKPWREIIEEEFGKLFGTTPSDSGTPDTLYDHLLIPDEISSLFAEPDSAVSKTFERNKHWQKMLVVEDVTGSMYPYTGQMLIWHKLNWQNKGVKHFVFFNDGDRKQDWQKKVGKTGGVYHVGGNSFDLVEETIYEAMRGGLGGDVNENNYEAILKGIRACPDCEEIIMIADNFAVPRDIELLTGIHKPIRIILCGASTGVNVEYLNLAKRNGGSIHTVEQDITELAKLNDGQTIVIGKEKFVIRNGKFYRTKGS